MTTKVATALTSYQRRFKNYLYKSSPDYAYYVLLLEIAIENQYPEKRATVGYITKLIQLYMIAVEVLESATDSRFEYFKKKIQSLMVKKHVVETLFQASSDCKKLEDSKMNCYKAELYTKKNQHDIQVYLHMHNSEKSTISAFLRKSDIQFDNYKGKVLKNITEQEQYLEARIKNRKMKSETGSISKYKARPVEDYNFKLQHQLAATTSSKVVNEPYKWKDYLQENNDPDVPRKSTRLNTDYANRNARLQCSSAGKPLKKNEKLGI